MHALLTRTLVTAAVLAVVPPLAAAPASARPEPGPSPTVTSWERPDGYDPGWDTYSYGSPAFGPNGVLRGELRRSVRRGQILRVADPEYLPVGGDQRGVADQPGIGLRIAGRAGGQFGNVFENEHQFSAPMESCTAAASSPVRSSSAQTSRSLRTS